MLTIPSGKLDAESLALAEAELEARASSGAQWEPSVEQAAFTILPFAVRYWVGIYPQICWLAIYALIDQGVSAISERDVAREMNTGSYPRVRPWIQSLRDIGMLNVDGEDRTGRRSFSIPWDDLLSASLNIAWAARQVPEAPTPEPPCDDVWPDIAWATPHAPSYGGYGLPGLSKRPSGMLLPAPAREAARTRDEPPANDETLERWTAKRRAALILEILRGDTTAAEAARTHGVPVAVIAQWKDRFLAGAEHALRG